MDLIQQIYAWLQPVHDPPQATIFILCLAVAISVVNALLNRKFIDVEQMKRMQREFREWKREFNEAQRSGDAQKLEKLKRKQSKIMKMQAQIMRQQLKAMTIFLIPILIVFWLLRGFYPQGHAVAYIPLWLPLIAWWDEAKKLYAIGFIGWYLLCAIGAGMPLLRMLGLTPTLEE